MPIGSGWDVPEEAQGWSDFTWWKVRGSKSLVLIMLCDQPVWYSGHFYKGRMTPCLGQDCAMCADGVGAQLRYVLTGMDPVSQRAGLLEVGRNVALTVREFAARNGGLRGLMLEFTKMGHSKHCRMEVYAHYENTVPGWEKVKAPDMKAALVATWEKAKLPYPEEYKERPGPSSLKGDPRPRSGQKRPQDGQESPLDTKDRPPAGKPVFVPPGRVR